MMQLRQCYLVFVLVMAALSGSYVTFRASGEQLEGGRPGNLLLGCFADSLHNRDMGQVVLEDDNMSFMMCQDQCRQEEKKFMGLQNGKECYCSDSYNLNGALEIPSSRCDIPCSKGEAGTSCGGSFANSVYHV